MLKSKISILPLLIPCLLNAQPPYTPAPPAPSSITRIEWFIDKDPGVGNGTAVTFTPSVDVADLAIPVPLSGIKHGVHRLFIRSLDPHGSWSLTAAATFENFHPAYTAAPLAPTPISQLELFFDNDPGFGKGFLQTTTAATNISDLALTLNIDTLSKGPHQLFVRTAGSLSATAPFSNDIPLPLTWLYFRGDIIDGQSHLSWGTAQESNTKEFDIEYSQDGHTFSSIGKLPAAGNSATPLDYTWTHTTPATGLNFYRIKQSDLDDRSTRSSIISLFYNTSLTKTTAIPNPVRNTLTLLLDRPTQQSTITVYSTSGQSLLTLQPEDGKKQQYLELGTLPAGVYFIRIRSKSTNEMIRILKE